MIGTALLEGHGHVPQYRMSQIVQETRLTAVNAWAVAEDKTTWRVL